MIISRLIPKNRILTVARRSPKLVRYVSEPVYDSKGYDVRPFLSTLSEYWLYGVSVSFACFMYFIMSSPLSEITPALHPNHPNKYSDKWYYLYPELEKYVRKNYEKLMKEKVDPKIVIGEVIRASAKKQD